MVEFLSQGGGAMRFIAWLRIFFPQVENVELEPVYSDDPDGVELGSGVFLGYRDSDGRFISPSELESNNQEVVEAVALVQLSHDMRS